MPASVHGHSEPAITPPEPQARWLCDQGCSTVEGWKEDEPAHPINRSQITCTKITSVKKAQDITDYGTIPSDDGMMPINHEDHEPPSNETPKTDVDVLPIDRPTATADSTEQAKATTSPVVALTPPTDRAAPKIRHVRPLLSRDVLRRANLPARPPPWNPCANYNLILAHGRQTQMRSCFAKRSRALSAWNINYIIG